MERPSRDQTFMALANVFSLRASCTRAKVGAVIVKGGHVLAHGYNGAPSGLPHCDQVPHQCSPSRTQGCTRAIHAEANAITYAAKVGVMVAGAVMFCTHEPCLACAGLIIQSGIKRVVFTNQYRSHDGVHLLSEAGVAWEWHHVDEDILLRA